MELTQLSVMFSMVGSLIGLLHVQPLKATGKLIDIELSHQNTVALLTYGSSTAWVTVSLACIGLTLLFLTTTLVVPDSQAVMAASICLSQAVATGSRRG